MSRYLLLYVHIIKYGKFLHRVFDLRSGQIAQTLTTAAPVTSIEVSEDGAFLTTSDGKVIEDTGE